MKYLSAAEVERIHDQNKKKEAMYLYRRADEYVLLYEDAAAVAKFTRNGKFPNVEWVYSNIIYPAFSFPKDNLDDVLPFLVRQGYRIAITTFPGELLYEKTVNRVVQLEFDF